MDIHSHGNPEISSLGAFIHGLLSRPYLSVSQAFLLSLLTYWHQLCRWCCPVFRWPGAEYSL